MAIIWMAVLLHSWDVVLNDLRPCKVAWPISAAAGGAGMGESASYEFNSTMGLGKQLHLKSKNGGWVNDLGLRPINVFLFRSWMPEFLRICSLTQPSKLAKLHPFFHGFFLSSKTWKSTLSYLLCLLLVAGCFGSRMWVSYYSTILIHRLDDNTCSIKLFFAS